MATSVPGQDVVMAENQTPLPIPTEEPKYGGFTRFEIELEVRMSLVVSLSLSLFPIPYYLPSRLLLMACIVCPISFVAILPQPSCFSEVLRESRFRRLP